MLIHSAHSFCGIRRSASRFCRPRQHNAELLGPVLQAVDACGAMFSLLIVSLGDGVQQASLVCVRCCVICVCFLGALVVSS